MEHAARPLHFDGMSRAGREAFDDDFRSREETDGIWCILAVIVRGESAASAARELGWTVARVRRECRAYALDVRPGWGRRMMADRDGFEAREVEERLRQWRSDPDLVE